MPTINPPRSLDFSKFVEFTLLLANPRELKTELDQFAKATNSFKEASKQYNDAVKIAATIKIAETLLVSNQEEASRLNVLSKEIEVNSKTSDARIAKDTKEQVIHTKRVEDLLASKQAEFEAQIKSASITLDKREKALVKREEQVAEDRKALEASLSEFNTREAKVQEAYAS